MKCTRFQCAPPLLLKFFMFNCLILITGISQSALSQEYTQGEMTFSVRTVTYNGDRSPRHVLVLWVEDSNGFVKTRELNGNRRKEWLLTWRASSKYNVVDATTGATLNSHTSHTVKWDCRDVTGNIVPNGDYSVYVEFTEEHAQGPLFKIDFTKSNDSVTIKPPDQSYFKDMNLTFKPVFVSAGFRYSIDGLNVSFTNTSSGADSFSWDFGDGTSSTEENPIHTFALEGTYPVKLYAKKGLFQSIEEQEISVTNPATGISPFMTGASVYPNPFHESIMIKPEKGSVIEVINIYSLNAIHMHSSLITASGEFEVSLADLPSGLYILQLSSKGQTTCQFIIKD